MNGHLVEFGLTLWNVDIFLSGNIAVVSCDTESPHSVAVWGSVCSVLYIHFLSKQQNIIQIQ
jgi:hypothetical protein